MRRLFRTSPEAAGQRADVYVTSLCPEMTRSRVAALMRAGDVLLNGAPVRPGTRLEPDQMLTVDVPEPEAATARPQEMALDVVYEDGDIIVINKARGIVVHPAAGNAEGTLVNALLFHCRDLSGIGGQLRPGIVHRLDKDTTGLLVAAKNDAAHRSLADQIQRKAARRIYVALVEGHPGEGSVDAPIGRHHTDRKRMAVVDGGRAAITHFCTLREFDHEALVRLELTTGRTHQIRVHMAYIGHPVVGDPVYGFKKQRYKLPGQMLHAAGLLLQHPRTGEWMQFTAPPPEDFLALLARLDPGCNWQGVQWAGPAGESSTAREE